LIGSLVGRFSTGIYPNFPWWSLSYIFLCIAGVVFIVGTDSVSTYRVAASSALSAAFVFAASAVALLVYEPDGGKQAAGAGFILLSMVTVSST
jgi:SHO1 osmosensor